MGLTRADRTRTGRRVAFLLLSMPRWVSRRVESVSFHDDETVRRRVSIDFALPTVTSLAARFGRRAELIPLAYLKKEPLRNFDLRDESGAALPALTKIENGELAAAVLEYVATRVVGSPLAPEVIADIEALAYTSDDEPLQLIERLFRQEGPARPTRYLLSQDPPFVGLARRLAETFMLVAPLTTSNASRRVLKFAYDEMLDLSSRSRRRRVAESMSWRPTRINLPVPGVVAAASYHLDVAAPTELAIVRARLVTESRIVLDEDPTPTRRAHLSTPLQPATAEALVDIAAPREGIIRGSLLTSLFTAVVLTFGAFRLSQLDSAREGVATLLVAVPAIVAAYVARPGEHALASRLLFGVRLAVVASGALSFAASAVLLAGPRGRSQDAAWWALTGLAWLLAAALAASFMAPKEPRRKRR